MLTLYEHPASGNCMKARILLRHLDIPYESVVLDIFEGEATEPEHLARNPSGEVPTLELENGQFVAQSAAVLLYLADRIARAEDELDVLETWLSEHDFLAAGRYTVADIANYGYTHVAHEVVDMSGRPAIAAWIARVESQPGFVNDLSPFP